MRECNAAWAALGTPAHRAAYDEQLRHDGLLPARAGSSPSVRPRRGSGRRARVGPDASVGCRRPTEHLVEPSRDFGILVPAAPHRPVGRRSAWWSCWSSSG